MKEKDTTVCSKRYELEVRLKASSGPAIDKLKYKSIRDLHNDLAFDKDLVEMAQSSKYLFRVVSGEKTITIDPNTCTERSIENELEKTQ
jgi:hypothetical protein